MPDHNPQTVALTPLVCHARPATVEAIRLTADNYEAVAKWCDAWMWHDGSITLDNSDGAHLALAGDWIIRTPLGAFTVMSNHEFTATYAQETPDA